MRTKKANDQALKQLLLWLDFLLGSKLVMLAIDSQTMARLESNQESSKVVLTCAYVASEILKCGYQLSGLY